MNYVAFFPGKYIQGCDAIQELETIIKQFGSKALLVTSPHAKNYIPEHFFSAPLSSQITISLLDGECCEETLGRLAQTIEESKAEVIIGMGGGKVIDTAKIAADRAGTPVIIVPTIAATDAPCSGCAVTYTANGEFEKVHYQKLNPAVVLVDVSVIAKAPLRFLVAGMGDALATWFEARSCQQTFSENECGGVSTLTGQTIARLCYDTLLQYGLRAKLDHEAGIMSPALHRIIEANILLSGIGFESGGLATAHAIHNGLTVLPETHSFYHGEKVAFGLLAGLHLNNVPPHEMAEVYGFCTSVGLPVTFAEIGIENPTPDKLKQVARKSTEKNSSIHHEPQQITETLVYQALIDADRYGQQFLSRLKHAYC